MNTFVSAASLASASAVAMPSVQSDVNRKPDPILALIERHRELHAAAEVTDGNWADAYDARLAGLAMARIEAARDIAIDAESRAAWTLVAAIPATLEGVAARLAYVRDLIDVIGEDTEMMDALRNSTEAALWALAA